MTLNAFERYLLAVPRETSVKHLFECLKGEGEMAWELMEKINGPNWSVKPENFHAYLDQTIAKLAAMATAAE